ncbi:unnamed protein product [Medioppia subpectinata]|uniref:Uncharacterized protein n=1 Tax=Medioppia subpectinata TaxID=1979941 RepID=A0A7R9KCY8_9ACAR|nr:unnamed protein product [Medioppia subpectinata]CAG2099987.1 unnamed protein product [Medioppia subpectinata]
MNRADEIRDQIRQMRYLIDEKKLIDDMLRKVDDQRNRLQLEEMQIRTIIYNTNQSLNESREEEETGEEVTANGVNDDSIYLSCGTPSGAIEEPIINSFSFKELPIGDKEPKAVAETIELDVSKVLLRLACGGAQHIPIIDNSTEEEEEEDDDQ